MVGRKLIWFLRKKILYNDTYWYVLMDTCSFSRSNCSRVLNMYSTYTVCYAAMQPANDIFDSSTYSQVHLTLPWQQESNEIMEYMANAMPIISIKSKSSTIFQASANFFWPRRQRTDGEPSSVFVYVQQVLQRIGPFTLCFGPISCMCSPVGFTRPPDRRQPWVASGSPSLQWL